MKDNLLFGCVKFSNLLSDAQSSLKNFAKKQDGVTAIEYAVIAVAVTTALLAVFGSDGNFTKALTDKFKVLSDALGTNGGKK